MAQIVGYWENNVVYEEGPFVAVDIYGNFRVEVEHKGKNCPTLPDGSILLFLEKKGYPFYGRSDIVMRVVDFLNEQTRNDTFVFDGKWWIHQEEE